MGRHQTGDLSLGDSTGLHAQPRALQQLHKWLGQRTGRVTKSADATKLPHKQKGAAKRP